MLVTNRSRHQVCSLVLSASLLCACAPLQQAPLVYTSGQVYGLKIGTSPTQAEAFEIIIGGKLLDAAYAPVAVARPPATEFKDSTKNGLDWGIKEIYGVFGEELTPDSHKRLNPDEIRTVREYLQAAVDLRDKQVFAREKEKLLSDARQVLSDKKTQISQLNAKCSDDGDVKPECSDKANQLTTLNAQAEAAALDIANVKEPAAKLAKSELSNAEGFLGEKQGKALEALQKLSNVRKKDALSVYGSFNNNTTASNDGKSSVNASIKLGKVFSTGVAAQNISEAEKSIGIAYAVSACMNSLAEVGLKIGLKDKAVADFIDARLDKCLALSKNDVNKTPG